MVNWLRALMLQVMKVPPEPAPPFGSPGSIRVFRAGRNYYRWRLFAWGATQIATVIGLLWAIQFSGVLFARIAPKLPKLFLYGFQFIEAIGIAGVIMLIPVTLLQQKLDYELRWYIVTDRSLRIRHGLWTVEELTMTFANIQQIRVKQGPLQRYLGIANVEVKSAGGGAVSSDGKTQVDKHLGVFAGVDNAEAIRDLMIERLREYRDAGLGDPDEQHGPDGATELLGEARALRGWVESLEQRG